MKDLRLFVKIKNNLILQTAEELWGKGISQSALAQKIGLSNSVIGGYLNFKLSPITNRFKKSSLPVDGANCLYWNSGAMKICNALNKNPEDIFPEHLREARKSSFQFELESAKLLADLKRPELDLDKHVELIELKEKVREKLATLKDPRQEKVLRMRFGIDEDHEYTYSEIGEAFGVSGTRISQIEARGLRLLRHPSRAKILREFVN